MGSKVNSQQAQVQWLREITKAKLNPFLYPSFYQNNGKRGQKGNLDNFGQVWTILGKFGQVRASFGKLGQVRTRQQIRKIGEKAERIRKGNKNLSGDGEEEGEGGESRV